MNEPPPLASDVRPGIPAAFDEVVATALAKAPDDRYASCGELARASEAALRGELPRGADDRAVGSHSACWRPPSWRPRPPTVGIVLTTTVGTLRRRDSRSRPSRSA